jgi:hypothetical protein
MTTFVRNSIYSVLQKIDTAQPRERSTMAERQQERKTHRIMVREASALVAYAITLITAQNRQFKTLAEFDVSVLFRKKPSLFKQYFVYDRDIRSELLPVYSLNRPTGLKYHLLEDGSIAVEIEEQLNQSTTEYNRLFIKEFSSQQLVEIIVLLVDLVERLSLHEHVY